MQVLKKLFLNTKIQLLIILVATSLVYSNTLHNEFVIEDGVFIRDWKLTQDLGNIPKMFAGDTSPTGNIGVYRPLRGVFYSLSYKLWGGSNPFPYHVQAILAHLIVTVLVYFIARQLTSVILTPGVKKMSLHPRGVIYLPFLTALLFGLHPVHTEAIDYLTASFDTMAYVFFFGSFYLYLKAQSTSKVKKMGLHLRGVILGGSLIFATAAFFHFEMTLTLPLLLLGYELIVQSSKFKVQSYNSKLKIAKFKFFALRFSLYALIPFFLSAFFYLFIRFGLLQITARSGYLENSFYFTMLTMLKVVLKYLEWLVLPLNLSINPRLPGGISAWPHPLSYLDRITSQKFFDPFVILSILIILALLFAAFYLRKKYPLVTFSIAWFFISILPVLYIIPQHTIFQERYIYIASFGFCLVISYWLLVIGNLLKTRNITSIIIIIIILSYAYLTYQRNKDWKDSFALWTTLARQYPEDILGNFYSAAFYGEKGMYDQAIFHYNQALKVEPRLHETHFALGKIYAKLGNIDLAAARYQQAIMINPKYQEALQALDKLNQDPDDIWIECSLGKTVIFSCPKTWIKKTANKTIIQDPKSDFRMEISRDDLKGQAFNDYLNNQKPVGEIVQDGLAQIPGVDFSFVRVYKDKLEFFLLKGEVAVHIFVSPQNSPKMIKFDRVVTSLKLLNNDVVTQ